MLPARFDALQDAMEAANVAVRGLCDSLRTSSGLQDKPDIFPRPWGIYRRSAVAHVALSFAFPLNKTAVFASA